MVDVFISYKREEKTRIDNLAGLLRDLRIKDVWTDASLKAGEVWHAKIQSKARAARCVLVCWSESCAQSKWVQEEMEIGRERGVLIVARLDDSACPESVRERHCPDLSTWQAGGEHAGIIQLADGLGQILEEPLGARLEEYIHGRNSVAVAALRAMLVGIARGRHPPISYSAAYDQIAHHYLNAGSTSRRTLYGTLDEIADENRKAREPPLFGLVVNHETGLPGQGYFQKHCYLPNEFHPMAVGLHQAHLERVYGYDWPRDA